MRIKITRYETTRAVAVIEVRSEDLDDDDLYNEDGEFLGDPDILAEFADNYIDSFDPIVEDPREVQFEMEVLEL